MVVDLVRHNNFQTNEWLRQVPSGHPHTPAKGTLWQIRFDPKTGKVLENQQQLDLECDFPIVSPLESGQQARRLYLAVQSQPEAAGGEMFDSLACIDPEGKTAIATLGAGCYPMEPIYAPDGLDPNRGWILTVVFDGHRDRSTLQVFDF